jgi:hypothetical protein
VTARAPLARINQGQSRVSRAGEASAAALVMLLIRITWGNFTADIIHEQEPTCERYLGGQLTHTTCRVNDDDRMTQATTMDYGLYDHSMMESVEIRTLYWRVEGESNGGEAMETSCRHRLARQGKEAM